MISKLYNYWQLLKGSLWLIPAICCFLYFSSSLILYEVEVRLFPRIDLPDVFFNGSAEDAKSVTMTLLSSMITMATLSISITVVALSLAASQLGPRLIKTFMEDQRTQIYIGLFFGVVVACFMLTVILHDASPKAITPHVTISYVFTLCFANLFVLLAFVNHVAKSIIADNVILKVSNELINAVSRLTKSREYAYYKSDKKEVSWPDNFENQSKHLCFKRSGYAQHIDYEHLASLSLEHNLYLNVRFRPGRFLISGQDGIHIYPAAHATEEVEKSILDSFIIGDTRTSTQDIEYSIRHLVEIASRALSPGINDSFTAITVLDYLSKALGKLFENEIPLEWIEDEKSTTRICVERVSEQTIIFSAFDQIRNDGAKKPEIIRRILEKLDVLLALSHTTSQKSAIKDLIDDVKIDIENLDSKNRQYHQLKSYATQIIKDD